MSYKPSVFDGVPNNNYNIAQNSHEDDDNIDCSSNNNNNKNKNNNGAATDVIQNVDIV